MRFLRLRWVCSADTEQPNSLSQPAGAASTGWIVSNLVFGSDDGKPWLDLAITEADPAFARLENTPLILVGVPVKKQLKLAQQQNPLVVRHVAKAQ